MPTKILHEKYVVQNKLEWLLPNYKKALIVTGKSSAKLCGALEDVTNVLDEHSVDWVVYDGVRENPTLEQVGSGASVGKGCDFVIGIGGGSPIDAAKGIAVMIKMCSEDVKGTLYNAEHLDAVPVIAIPTTAGTGTETTPYAIFTDMETGTKSGMRQRVFPEFALMDVRYFMTQPQAVRNSTCVDAMTHSVESYMVRRSTPYSEYIALESLRLWGENKSALLQEEIAEEAMEGFMMASTLAGVAISQTGTSLPHGMGYPLTLSHNVPHGKANGLLIASYLNFCENKYKVAQLMEVMGFANLKAYDQFLRACLGEITVSKDEMEDYVAYVMKAPEKLKQHVGNVREEDVRRMYMESIGGSYDRY